MSTTTPCSQQREDPQRRLLLRLTTTRNMPCSTDDAASSQVITTVRAYGDGCARQNCVKKLPSLPRGSGVEDAQWVGLRVKHVLVQRDERRFREQEVLRQRKDKKIPRYLHA